MLCHLKKILGAVGILKILQMLQISVKGGRKRISKKYIHGKGLEIGALHQPLWVNNECKVLYVDRLNAHELTQHYPEIHASIKVDIVDDGEILQTVKDESQDFIIANHVLEHCENPIKTIHNHLTKLKTGGVLFYAIPDKRFSFDRRRDLTSFEHIEKDYRLGEAISRDAHYREWVEKVSHCGQAADIINAEIKRLQDMQYSIHFHCWNKRTLKNFLKKTRTLLNKKFEICLVRQNFYEIVVILRKIKAGNFFEQFAA